MGRRGSLLTVKVAKVFHTKKLTKENKQKKKDILKNNKFIFLPQCSV